MNFTKHHTCALSEGTLPPRAYYTVGKPRYLKKWGFRYYPDEITVEEALSCTAERTIPVPSCWETLGYGSHGYYNLRYPFPYDPPRIERENPCAVYIANFSRKDPSGRYYLRFEGVDSHFYVFVNGREIGYSSVSHSPSEFDLTDHLAEENELRVVVFKFGVGSYLEDQDKLRMSGIFRDVCILHRPEGHLFDYTVRTSYDERTGKGTLEVEADKDCAFTLAGEGVKKRARGKRFRLTLPVRPWTAETPVLYSLTLACAGERISEKVGFRTVRAEGNVFTLNGKPIKFRGVNRHSMTEKGYVETEEDLVRDLDLLRELHANAIRTSHYPPHPLLPKLCDERGIYLLEEADVESHGSTIAENEPKPHLRNAMPEDPAYREQFVGRAMRMYGRDKNRPCVLIWSLGNESGWGKNLAEAARALKGTGDGRLIHYEGAWDPFIGEYSDDGGVLDLYSRMYPERSWLETFAPTADRPVILCEYTHAMGNSCGDIGAYWDLIRKYPSLCGGFIWEWCSHSVIKGGKVLYGGDFGEYPDDGNFCMDGIVTTDRKKNPEFHDVARVYLPYAVRLEGDALVVKNNADFVPLGKYEDRCNLRYRVDDTLFEGGTFDVSALPAGGEMRIPLSPPDLAGERFAELRFERSGELFQLPLSRERGKGEERNALSYSVEGGKISSLKLGGKELLRSPVMMCCMRAPIDNDMTIAAAWRTWGLDRARLWVLHGDGKGAEAVLAAESLSPIARMEISYRDEGGLVVETKVRLADYVKSLPRFGFVFDLNAAKDAPVKWYGLGPGEAYEDRNFASTVGLYTAPADGMRYEYPKPQESGSRCGTRFVAVGVGTGTLMADSDTPFSFCVSPYLPADMKPHRHELRDTGHVYLYIDYRMAGVGSNSCGPAIDEKYLITEREFTFRFRLRSADDLFAAHWSKI